jgi:CubicO group peptidase (beta-lactamase class C family)
MIRLSICASPFLRYGFTSFVLLASLAVSSGVAFGQKEAPKDIPIRIGEKGVPITERMAFHHIPGVSIALIRDYKLAWIANFGEASRGRPMSGDTLFQVGTMGNTLVTSAALRAVQEKKISLDATINDYLKAWKSPQFPGGRPLTIRDLLENKSGLIYHKYFGYNPLEPVPTLLQVLNGEKPATTPPTRLTTAPGSTYNLAAENYVVLQQAIEDRFGVSYDSVARRLIFDPLGMKRSTFALTPSDSLRSQVAVGHGEDGEPLENGWRVYPESAAAGLWTTSRDFAIYLEDFMRSIAGKPGARILSRENADLMLKALSVDSDGDEQMMALGRDGYNNRKYLFRGGNAQGYYNIFNIRPETGSGILIMTNRNLCWQFANEVRDALALQEKWPGF